MEKEADWQKNKPKDDDDDDEEEEEEWAKWGRTPNLWRYLIRI